jgi:hypothetical protein
VIPREEAEEGWRNEQTQLDANMRKIQLSVSNLGVAAMAVLLLLGLCAPAIHSQGYELVINNGRVIDPESKLDAVRSVGIRAGKIAAISNTPLSGKKTIDAKGPNYTVRFFEFCLPIVA